MIPAEVRAAAALSGPRAGALREDHRAGIDPVRVIEVLRANKVPLLELAGEDLALTAAWRAAVGEETRQRDGLAEQLAAVTGPLSALGIRPVLFKSAGGLPYRSSNVDMLVRPAEMQQAAALLESLGHLRFPHYREDHKLLFRRFRRGRSAICVHLHDAVSWGRILVLPGDDVMDRSRGARDGAVDYRIACSEDLLLVTLAHSLYETDQVRLSDLRAVRLCAADPRLDWAATLERVSRRGWNTGFFSILSVVAALETRLYGRTALPQDILERARAHLGGAPWARVYVGRMTRPLRAGGTVAMPFALSKVWSKAHATALMMSAPGRSADERLADLVATAWNLLATRAGIRCRPAVIVSLSGLDGSGKSSAIRAVREAMTLCEIPVRVVWSRGGFTAPVRAAKRAARSVIGGGLPGPAETERKRRWLSGPVAGAAFAALVVAEQAVHYLLRVRAPRWRGTSIVCDRFVCDAVADLEAKLGAGRWITRVATTLAVELAPRPDLGIVLRLDPAQAERRKPGDAPIGMLARQAAALDRMAARLRLRVVDAGRPEDDVFDEVVDAALRAAFARFAGRRP